MIGQHRCLSLAATLVAVACSCIAPVATIAQETVQVLFLGDNGHHKPADRAQQLIPVMAERGIRITYTENASDLNKANLKKYAGLIIYANTTEIKPDQEAALLEYVAEGGGFIPLHCASYCFLNSPAYIDLVGAQFQMHGGEVFTTEIVAPEHPIMKGFGGFQSWDETYVHTKHNERNRTVLEVRKQGGQADGKSEEPWTWVRTQGKGRVFYTAWGHDARTWSNPGFLNLVERGIRWAVGGDPSVVPGYMDLSVFPLPQMTALTKDVAPFEYEEVGPKIPNYVPSNQWGARGDNLTKMQKPLSPAESMKHYSNPVGFHLELFASEPELKGKPIAMNWDERGRLWVCETVDYPNELKDAIEGRDRIRILEDTDGDGKADKFTVFAEQLSIPTSIEFYRGGVIVQAGIETIFLRDTNGDDKADERETLIRGWAMGDTHGGVSNFQYGLDNRYWAIQGYNDSHPEYAKGKHPGFRQGPFNFTVVGNKPEVTDVEFVRSTSNNSWGLGISEEGLLFGSTANRAPSFFVPIPNRYYERVKGWAASLRADDIFDTHLFKAITDKVRQVDHHGGYTAGAGHAIYTARSYPKPWWNHIAFVAEPTGHLVGGFVLTESGASFTDTNSFNLIAADDEWAAPIMAEVGPDGQVWVIDWYNYIVQHNPTPQGFKTGKGNAYESDLRDKTHGRIYRVVYDQAPASATSRPKLSIDDPASLVRALSHSNRLWRRHAQRLLVERGKTDIVPALVGLVQNTSTDEIGINGGAIHALWTLHGLGALNKPEGAAYQAAVAALKHPSRGVRRNAALVLPHAAESISALAQSGILKDSEPQVRLAAVLALADMPADVAAGSLLASAARDPETMNDRVLKEAVICAGAAQAAPLLVALTSSAEGAINSNELKSAQLDMVTVLAEHLARSNPSDKDLNALFVGLSSGDASVNGAIIAGLTKGWPRDSKPTMTPELEKSLETLVSKLDLAARGQIISLAGNWGSEKLKKYAAEIIADLTGQIESNDASIEKRLNAVKQLIQISAGSDEAVEKLASLLTPQAPPELSAGIIRALGGSRSTKVSTVLFERWAELTPSLRNDAVAVLLLRPDLTRELVDKLSSGPVSVADLSLDQRQSLSSHPDRKLRDAAIKIMSAGGLPSADRAKVLERYAATAHNKGDAAKGKALFKKNCANCHKHYGEGQEIGPDLTGMAVHPKEELLIHILDPSRSVEGNFRRYTVLTADGKVLAGMLAAESRSAIEIIDAEGKRQSIARDDVDKITATNKSLMPEGFEEQIKEPDMTDLLEFLTTKGRFVPLPLAAAATAVSTKGLFHNGDEGPDRFVLDDWKPRTVQGVPFQLVDPQGKAKMNIVMLHGPQGTLPPKMPGSVKLPCNMPVAKLHLLSGVSGWGYPASRTGTTSLIVRFHYADGKTEDHELKNGEHFADYIRRVDVPKSEFAFSARGQQIRYLSVSPERQEVVKEVELVKGKDDTAPIIVAVTAEQPGR
ncbi:MAG: PVC-type heme-binding CxxCH protein [Pirellulales bacterium]